MLAHSDVHARAYDDFVRALTLDPDDPSALEGFVRSAVLLQRSADALAWIKTLAAERPPTTARGVAISKLLAAGGAHADALAVARDAATWQPTGRRGPGAGGVVAGRQRVTSPRSTPRSTSCASGIPPAPPRPSTRRWRRFLKGDPAGALAHAERAIAIDPAYAPVYDLAGAAHTKLGQPDRARAMFERSLVVRRARQHRVHEPRVAGACGRTPSRRAAPVCRGVVARPGVRDRARRPGPGAVEAGRGAGCRAF